MQVSNKFSTQIIFYTFFQTILPIFDSSGESTANIAGIISSDQLIGNYAVNWSTKKYIYIIISDKKFKRKFSCSNNILDI